MIMRNAVKKDFDEYLSLKKQVVKKMNINNSEIKKEFDFILRYPNKNRIILVSEQANKINGYLVGTFLMHAFQKIGYIDDLFVKKEFRRKRVATSLIKEFMKIAEKRNLKRIRLGVAVKNKNAIKLYQKLGFKITHYEMQKN